MLRVRNEETGQEWEVPIQAGGVVDAKVLLDPAGLRLYDPGLVHTAPCRSSISWVDGANGQLWYRGYPIEQLVRESSFLEVAYFLIYGELPNAQAMAEWEREVMTHTFVHTRLDELMRTFNYDAHPMGMFIATMAAMSTFHPEANPALQGALIYNAGGGGALAVTGGEQVSSSSTCSPPIANHRRATPLADDPARAVPPHIALQNKQIKRILGKAATIAARAYRHRIGRPFNQPPAGCLNFVESFLVQLDSLGEHPPLQPHPTLLRILDQLFIIHAEHELNCSTATMRALGSARADPYTAIAGAAGALYGPLHGGACQAVLQMLAEIGSVERVPWFLAEVRARRRKLMGFGHRIYRAYDPRAKLVKSMIPEVFAVCGREPLLEVAMALEEQALADGWFVERNLYPNVDFYTGLIYKAMGFPTDFFPLLFALPRIVGWLAHWREQQLQPTTNGGGGEDNGGDKIWRPSQWYCGPGRRDYVPLSERNISTDPALIRSGHQALYKRYALGQKNRE